MTNALISATTQQIWLKTGKILRDKYQFDVKYWICQEEFFDDVSRLFPSAIIHNRIDLSHGQFPGNAQDHDFLMYPIGSDIITRHASSTLQCLKMMDRLDPKYLPFKSFDYNSRIRHYYRLLSYWYHVLNELDIDIAIFESSPHTVGDYVLYEVLQELEINKIVFYSSLSNERKLVTTDLTDGFHLDYSPHEDYKISEELQSKINLIQSDYDLAQPPYQKQKSTNSLWNFANNRFRKADHSLYKLVTEFVLSLRHLNKRHPNSFVKTRAGSVENNVTTRFHYYLYRMLAFNKRRVLRKHYENMAVEPNLNSKYIYLNLHYQPEKTTSPDAGHFVHQYLIANLLSKSLPDDVELYIKEHPSQFSADLFGEQGRKTSYYNDLLKLDNSKLIKMSLDQFDLVDNALAVATCTGEVGWESLVRGIPVLSFGQPWYADCPGCYKVTNYDDLIQAIDLILSQSDPNMSDVLNYAGLVESKSLNFKPNLKNANSLAKCIEKLN
jgi:hypothetical protein